MQSVGLVPLCAELNGRRLPTKPHSSLKMETECYTPPQLHTTNPELFSRERMKSAGPCTHRSGTRCVWSVGEKSVVCRSENAIDLIKSDLRWCCTFQRVGLSAMRIRKEPWPVRPSLRVKV